MRHPSRPRRAPLLACAALLVLGAGAGCDAGGSDPGEREPEVTPAGVSALLAALSADSMEGRFPGTSGERRAATLIAARMAAAGLQPGGDSGYFQRVPVRLAMRRLSDGRLRLVPSPVASFAALDTVPAERRRTAVNVVGVLRGSDAAARDSAVLLTAHFDHLGVSTPAADGDSVYNGADDNASGVTGILETARMLGAQETAPRRTVVFIAFTGEEEGMIGSTWYAAHPTIPLARTTSNLNVEMITRPDGASGAAWLSGYERSTMGAQLAAAGLAVTPDMRPELNVFLRSDNRVFAYAGIPAHTLCTWNLHTDYHQPSDEAPLADPSHMAAVIRMVVRATRLLADGAVPTWNEGGRP